MNSHCVMRAMSRASVVLPTPGGPPQDDGAELVALDLPAQRLVRPQDVLLAHELFERARPHALGQRALAVHRRVVAGQRL